MVSERPYQDEEWLRQKLDGNSVSEIADVAGVTDVTIYRWVEKNDLQEFLERPEMSGPDWESRRNAACFGHNSAGYEQWQCGTHSNIVYVHRLLAVSEYGIEAVKGEDVHHRNGVKWDNRPENIELKDKGKHAADHQTWVTDEACIESLKEARDELGEIPTKKQYDSLDLSPSSKRVAEQFGSWAEAHREVFGYTTSGPFIEEDCYEAIRRARDQLGHEPTSQEYIDLDIPPSMTTIRKTVGSWSEAKKNALEN